MERIFYKTELTDAYSGHPIYVFDTSHLPAPEEIDYELFIPSLMLRLPSDPYVVVMFSCGLNKINWVWGIKFLKAFLTQAAGSNSNADNIHKIIAVHESFFVKSVSQFFTNFMGTKKGFPSFNALFDSAPQSKNFLVSCPSLAELSEFVDVPRLKLSISIYRHDYQITGSPALKLHCPTMQIITPSTSFDPQADPLFMYHFCQIFNILEMHGPKVDLLFHKPGKKLNTEILFHCISRNQLLWINDWDLSCVASCFKKILSEIRRPLMPVDAITIPMRNDFEYTVEVFNKLSADQNNATVLFQIFDLCQKITENEDITGHSSASISRCLCHCLTHESPSTQNRDRVSIAVRFMKNVLLHWAHIRPLYTSRVKTAHQVMNDEKLHDDTIDESYNMSQNMTMHSTISSEDENESTFETQNIIESLHITNEPSPKSVETLFEPHAASESPHSAKSPQKSPQKLSQGGFAASGTKEKSMESKSEKTPNDARPQLQFPPQKYKFERSHEAPQELHRTESMASLKKPVIRGRKVGELTRIFEERTQAIEILRTL